MNIYIQGAVIEPDRNFGPYTPRIYTSTTIEEAATYYKCAKASGYKPYICYDVVDRESNIYPVVDIDTPRRGEACSSEDIATMVSRLIDVKELVLIESSPGRYWCIVDRPSKRFESCHFISNYLAHNCSGVDMRYTNVAVSRQKYFLRGFPKYGMKPEVVYDTSASPELKEWISEFKQYWVHPLIEDLQLSELVKNL